MKSFRAAGDIGKLLAKKIAKKITINLLLDAGECVTKNVFCDIVKPDIGSVLKIDLIFSAGTRSKDICHTGIYIGNNEIVELTQNDLGDAVIRIVSPERFIEGDALSPRTGLFIYVACGKNKEGNCYALGNKNTAERAAEAVGKIWWGKYDILKNNCHMFARYCITGSKTSNPCLIDGVEAALAEIFGISEVCWRSTSESRGDNPRFTDENKSNPDNETDKDTCLDEVENSEFDELLEKAEGGDSDAQFQVAECYCWGDGVDKDEEKAFQWYTEAADNGHAEAMYQVADCYYLGTGVDEDEEEAVSWYRKAARKGHVEAMIELAQRYYDGNGVQENRARAKDWFKRAADAGSRDAKKKLKDYF